MGVPDFEKRNTFDEAFGEERAVEQRLLRLLAPCRSQPCGQWHAEAAFAAVHDFVRQQIGEGRFQNTFAIVAMEFEIPWKSGGEFDQLVVEKR